MMEPVIEVVMIVSYEGAIVGGIGDGSCNGDMVMKLVVVIVMIVLVVVIVVMALMLMVVSNGGEKMALVIR